MENDKSFELLPHQQLWNLEFTIADGSCWQVIAVTHNRKTIIASWVEGQTTVGILNLSGKRLASIAVKDVVELLVNF
ncbi:hypothetical protein [Rivularia sp. PCC 7116]|uniref:hypothetical protein n=1 Tax=Rivularia sp. PCC 7116 TaxID=373994 RepID=UPI0002D47F23|nr:hypothetical protein [Rivularia sp. PCC 7116]